MTHRNTWKGFERVVARFFGSERTPLSGGNSKITRSDSLHPRLYIEDKYRSKHSVIQLWLDASAKATAEGKTPVVCLRQKGLRGFWLVVHSEDAKAVLGEIK